MNRAKQYAIAIAGVLWLCGLGAAQDERNLLVNPSFEKLGQGENPHRWDVFVMPKDGAYGRLEPYGDRGEHAVALHNPEPYATEPANNWSQTVYGDFAGQELVLAGSIKTEDATEAALWVQCWHREPLRVLASFTSSTEFPVYGDTDWDEVYLKFTVPANTQFLVVRCVLKGEGTAWFDTLRMMRREDAVDVGIISGAKPRQEPATAETKPVAAEAGDTETTPAPPPPTDTAVAAENPAPATAPPLDDRALVLDANATLRSALETMSMQNTMLLQQIQALQAELAEMRAEIMSQNAAPEPAPETPKAPERGHVLVPRGYQEGTQP